ncbi:heterogeneous nuclear ribonucleoprotein 1-like [Cornus florida]|uniref:heterogeneous nuclear ribonucleoprotein 1-like n=1 Tax=Cornus florida TaxID=4283 RepID=UPI00289979C6|nr:heterogeneous nuclear ribonucleoprotein 1-like [Cornus florida]XP_059624795.1 heterogeneous nuclear ribonucleoprotein 1-like [Cornus florida]
MEMELGGKLFIGGISWDTNEDGLREYFHTFGEVVEAVIMKDRNTGRARGFGFVVFADPTIAERVVKEKHIIDGRIVEAKKAVPRDDQHILNRNNGCTQGSPGPIRTKKIFVGGLASTVTESDFKKYFDQFGTITDVVVMYDHNTQRPRGFGFITYDSEEAVEKVLLKNFHDLNGKMVEVKRAVPKELSPGPSRSQFGGYSHDLSRVSSFLNPYTQGYNPSSIGGYGIKMDGRSSPVTVARSGYPPFSPSDYGMGLNFEPELSPSHAESGNFNPRPCYGRDSNPSYSGNSNRYGSLVGYGTGSGGTGSVSSSTSWNMWGNQSSSYATRSANSIDFISSASGNSGLIGAFGSLGAIWGSSPITGQGGGTASAYSSGNISFGSADNSSRLRAGAYGRNSRSSAVPTTHVASRDAIDQALGNLYKDFTWRSSSPELEGSGSYVYGLGDVTKDVMTKISNAYANGCITNRSNRGIAT